MNASFANASPDRAHSVGGAARFWDRLRKAASDLRLDRSEREVGRFLQENGGRLTDDLERRILDRISGLDQSGFH